MAGEKTAEENSMGWKQWEGFGLRGNDQLHKKNYS